MTSRLVYVSDWEEKGIKDCEECSEDLCYICNDPSDLPKIITRDRNDLYQLVNNKLRPEGDCSECLLEIKIGICESYADKVKTPKIEAILISEDFGLFKIDICTHFNIETHKCNNYLLRPKICRDYSCQ